MSSASSAAPVSQEESTTSSGSDEYDDAIESVAIAAVQLAMRVAQDAPPVRPPGFYRRTTLVRQRVEANDRLMRHYFSENPTFNERMFRRRFRMSKRLFLKITGDLEAEYPYFQQRYDAAGKLGFSAIQKCTSALRQLATGQTGDLFDEYLEMSDRTSRETLEHFCRGIRELYEDVYLRRPTWSDLQRLYEVHDEVHGFPGMIGSIDCMHWAWEMCPTAWRGTHTRGDVGHPSLMLQAVASYDLWIWNAYFGKQGSNNDINVFESSPVLEEIIFRLAPTSSFYANGNFYKCGYYLTDGIYPEYTTFVKSFTDPFDEKRQLFKRKQESARKAIERAFGVLKKRWHVIKYPARYWKKETMVDVVYACIIMHNMILQDEDRAFCQDFNPEDPTLDPTYWMQQTPIEQRIANGTTVRDREVHNMLKADLVEHLWANRRRGGAQPDNEPEFNINDYFSDEE